MSVPGFGAVLQDAQTALGAGLIVPPPGTLINPQQPNIGDFWAYLLYSAQVPLAALPLTSPYPPWAFEQACKLVNSNIGGPPYVAAVYNCGTHVLLSITPDQSGQNFFGKAQSRDGFGLALPSTGLVAATSDETDSTTLNSPKWADKIAIDQLDFFRTPWGRSYLAYNQKFGPTVWGLT